MNMEEGLLVNRKKVGQPPKPKPTKITDFFQSKKNATEEEKLKTIIETVSNDSMQQICSLYLDGLEPDSEGNTHLKRVRGYPKKIVIDKVKPRKAVISHKTLFRIKSICDESGNSIKQIAQILNKNPDVKIEPNFVDALTEKGHACADFFTSTVLEMYVYEEKDYQLWSYTKEGNLVDKTGQLPFRNKQFNLPEEGQKGYIQEVSTNKVLCPKNKAGSDIVFNKKKLPKKVTRSSKSAKSVPIDDQMWIRGHADVNGWFSITHQKSGNFLTSSNSDKVTVQEHHR